jgi:hypothetical protein
MRRPPPGVAVADIVIVVGPATTELVGEVRATEMADAGCGKIKAQKISHPSFRRNGWTWIARITTDLTG